MTAPSVAMRLPSHAGTRPPWRGRSALPVRKGMGGWGCLRRGQPSRKIRPSRAAVAFGHATERDGIAWYLDRRDAVLPLMARRTAHPINRAWRRPKHEALPFVADRPAEAERTGRAQRQPKD